MQLHYQLGLIYQFLLKDILDEAGFDDDEMYSEEINFTDNNFFKDENLR